jgi:hypothetical protein
VSVNRGNLYRFPWSKTDNPGGWIEVTDECDLFCPGCYRHRLEGHRRLEEIKEEIAIFRRLAHCDRIAIAGGEPLIYPHIVEVVDFISKQKMKPMILTNGEKLTWELAKELKKAGLVQFYFHVDSAQERPGWTEKTELEMNKLRQHFADLVWELGGVQCGYNITIFPSTLKYIPDIVEWSRTNIHKVQHLSLIAFRSVLLTEEISFTVNGKEVDLGSFQCKTLSSRDVAISTDKMFELLEEHYPESPPSAYLNGTTSPESYKFLIILNLGSRKKMFGVVGKKTVEMVQVFYHLLRGRYCAFLKNPVAGKKVFLLSFFDKEIKKAFINFLKASVKNPRMFFDKIYVQCINLQQPNEVLNGQANLCDGCLNMMIYKGKFIHSCQLDEYRLFGGPLQPRLNKKSVQSV